jgi:xanthine/uracil permease
MAGAMLMLMKEDSFDDELCSFFKSSYEAEFARRDKFSDRINLGVTLLTILGGLVAFYLSAFKPTAFSWAQLFFYTPLVLGVLIMSISLCLFRAAMAQGWDYHYLPHSETLARYVEDMKIANAPINKTNENRIRSEFIKTISGHYRLCATLNFYVNTERQKKLLRALRLSIWALVVLLATALPFFILKSGFNDEPQKVNIINPVEVKNGK